MQDQLLARSQPPSDDEPVRRVDANLRSRYPFLRTRLFALAPHRYLIVLDRQDLPAESVAEEFDNQIRFITLQVGVSNDLPASYVRELSPIDDHAIAAGYRFYSYGDACLLFPCPPHD